MKGSIIINNNGSKTVTALKPFGVRFSVTAQVFTPVRDHYLVIRPTKSEQIRGLILISHASLIPTIYSLSI
jgi:hypothetical protein